MSIEKLVRVNFAASAAVATVWWLQQLGVEVARYGFGLHTFNLNSTVLLFLLLLIVQALLFLTALVRFMDSRRALTARIVTGVFGALMLLILGLLGLLAAQHSWRIKCWNPTNIILLLYIGLSHLAFAAIKKSKAA